MDPRDLGFSLLITGVWSGIHLSWPSSPVWVTDVWCHIALTLLSRTHQYILVINAWPLFGTLAHVPCETLAHATRGTQLTWPNIASGQRRPRTGRYNLRWTWFYSHLLTLIIKYWNVIINKSVVLINILVIRFIWVLIIIYVNFVFLT